MWTSNEWFGSERKKLEEGLDPVNKEDEDIDNDGDVDSSDSYLHNRRKVISKAVKEDADLEEAKKPKPGHNAIVMAKNLEIIKKIIKKEEVEQIDEISKKLAKSYLDKSAAEREENPKYSNREKFRGRMIGGARADAKLKGRVEEPYKFGQAPKRKMRVKIAATEEVDVNESITDKDTVLVHTHKMGTDTGRYGTFNVDKVSNNILHAYDHNSGKMMKFNLKVNRGIGEHDNLYIKRVIK